MTEAVHGAIATSDPRATEAGADVLRQGGNALEAAVAAALVLYVVEPQSCGVGGDAFLIHSAPGEPPVALDGAGVIPAGCTEEALAADGLDQIPVRGGRTVTVPGAVALLEDALARFGSRALADLAGPALTYAREGFDVRPSLAGAAGRATETLAADPVLGPLYAPDGKPVAEGDRVVNPQLAECLDTLAREGAAAVYSGAIGQAIVETVQADGGYLTADDLRGHRTLPMDARSVTFRGCEVWELPEPTQGPAVLHALAALPDARPPWDEVVEAVHEGMRQAGFDPAAVGRASRSPGKGDTTFIACIDGDGRGASLITSVFGDFGAHLGVEALGGPVQNRATNLRMAARPLTPGDKPPHTIIPSLVTQDGGLQEVLGVAGGLMQPQAQVQILIRMLDEGMAPQEAIDAPRFMVAIGGGLVLEEGHELSDSFPDAVGGRTRPDEFGGAQVASRRGGSLAAGADPRRGGSALVF